jgi:hypothetical protein
MRLWGPWAQAAKLKLENLDSGIFGEEFPEGTLTVSSNADHFALMKAEQVLQQIEDLVDQAQALRRSAAVGGTPNQDRP